MSIKRPIEWHRSCLTNRQRFLDEEEKRLVRLTVRVVAMREETQKYADQIALAEQRRVTEFDADRFGIKRRAKI